MKLCSCWRPVISVQGNQFGPTAFSNNGAARHHNVATCWHNAVLRLTSKWFVWTDLYSGCVRVQQLDGTIPSQAHCTISKPCLFVQHLILSIKIVNQKDYRTLHNLIYSYTYQIWLIGKLSLLPTLNFLSQRPWRCDWTCLSSMYPIISFRFRS